MNERSEQLIREMTQRIDILGAQEARIKQTREALKLAKRKLMMGYNVGVVLAELEAEKIFDYANA